jgi:nitrogen fixation NifU-like protein
MGDLRELYQEVILEHAKKPRNFRAIDTPDRRTADGWNPLCGDRMSVFVRVEGGVVKEASFLGTGCAISTASASLMTETLKGRTEQDVDALYHRFHDLVTGAVPEAAGEDLGKLTVFAGVSEYPARVKCASLAWHALRAAMKNEAELVTTE